MPVVSLSEQADRRLPFSDDGQIVRLVAVTEATLADARLFMAQLMTIGNVEDVRWLLSVASSDDLRSVLRERHLPGESRPYPRIASRVAAILWATWISGATHS